MKDFVQLIQHLAHARARSSLADRRNDVVHVTLPSFNLQARVDATIAKHHHLMLQLTDENKHAAVIARVKYRAFCEHL